jgi:beta-barrel assembly-enhancing protease
VKRLRDILRRFITHTLVASLVCSIGLSPAHATARKPGVRPASASIEEGMWAEAAKSERQAAISAERVEDAALEAYVKRVTCKVAPEYCDELRVYVMDRPVFNATASPNGYLEVWSGLLLTASNEAELAFVLGHEVGHFEEQHSVDAFAQNKRAKLAATAASVAIAIVGVAVASNQVNVYDMQNVLDATRSLIDITYLSYIAGYFRFSREQETEADTIGFRRFSAAGYQPSAAAGIWQALVAQNEVSDFEKIRRGASVSNVFNSHPVSEDRIKYLTAMASSANVTEPVVHDTEYRAAIRPFLEKWLRRDLERRDYGQSLQLIERLMRSNTDLGVLYFMRGELFRKRNGGGDARSAMEAYQLALQYDDVPTVVHREMGSAAVRVGDNIKAKQAFGRYLTLTPVPQDAWLVKETMESLK